MSRFKGGYILSWRQFYLTYLLYVSIICTVSGVGEENKPAIVGGIASPTKSQGESAQLDCKVVNQGNVKVYWEQNFNNHLFTISSDSNIFVANPLDGVYPNNVTKYELEVIQNDDPSVTYRLTINRLGKTDPGSYICSLVSLGSDPLPTISATGTVTVRGIPSGPIIVYDIGEVTGRIDESAVLSCVVAYKGTSVVKWIRQRDNQEISSDGTLTISSSGVTNGKNKFSLLAKTQNSGERFDLTFNNLTEEDNGRYVCQVGTSNTPYTRTIGTLSVLVPPSITSETPVNSTLQIGGALELTCKATGSPTPVVVWQRVDSLKLPNGQQTYTGPTINIVNADKDQRGLYRCHASNKVLPDEELLFRVLVEFSPTAQAIHQSTSQAIHFPVEISCAIEGFPDVKPTWYKVESGGRREIIDSPGYAILNLAGDGWIQKISTSRFILRIEAVALTDYGQYQCEAVSARGSSADLITISQSATCTGIRCPPPAKGEESVTKKTETTTCKGNCTGGSSTQHHHRGFTAVLLIITMLISF